MNCAYSAMLHIFRYLTPQERFQAARVCKLWKDLALHASLWESLNLKVGQLKPKLLEKEKPVLCPIYVDRLID